MNRRLVVTVAIVQLVGAVGWLANASAPEPFGKPLWILGFVALLPGNLLAPPLVEEVLWSSPASLTAISVANLVASVILNLALATAFVLVRRRMQRAA